MVTKSSVTAESVTGESTPARRHLDLEKSLREHENSPIPGEFYKLRMLIVTEAGWPEVNKKYYAFTVPSIYDLVPASHVINPGNTHTLRFRSDLTWPDMAMAVAPLDVEWFKKYVTPIVVRVDFWWVLIDGRKFLVSRQHMWTEEAFNGISNAHRADR